MTKSRKRPKFRGLFAHQHRIYVRQFVDQDYVDALTDEERAWLAKFNREFYGCDFQERDNLHPKGSEGRRSIFNAHNARRRDVWNVFAVQVTDEEDIPDGET